MQKINKNKSEHGSMWKLPKYTISFFFFFKLKSYFLEQFYIISKTEWPLQFPHIPCCIIVGFFFLYHRFLRIMFLELKREQR